MLWINPGILPVLWYNFKIVKNSILQKFQDGKNIKIEKIQLRSNGMA